MKHPFSPVSDRSFYRRLGQLALPIAFQSLMLASVAAGDALMLGRVAQNEITAVSLATQIQFVQNMFLAAVTGAGAILGAQYWGKGDKRTLEDLFNLMLRWCGVVAYFAPKGTPSRSNRNVVTDFQEHLHGEMGTL